MAFDVGDLVIPEINKVANDIEFPTAGASGTVEFLNPLGVSPEGEAVFSYRVVFPTSFSGENTTLDDEGNPVTNSLVTDTFWFDEPDLVGGNSLSGIEAPDLPDPAVLQSELNASQSTTFASNQVINSVFDQLDPIYSNVYVSVENVSEISVKNNGISQDVSLDQQDLANDNVATSGAVTTARGQLLLQELAENFSELDAVLTESRFNNREAQQAADSQNAALNDEISVDVEAYRINFIESPQSVGAFSPASGTKDLLEFDLEELENSLTSEESESLIAPETLQEIIFNFENES